MSEASDYAAKEALNPGTGFQDAIPDFFKEDSGKKSKARAARPKPAKVRIPPPVRGKTLNAFGRFVRELAVLVNIPIFQISEETGIDAALLSRYGYEENPESEHLTRNQAQDCVDTLGVYYQEVPGFPVFWRRHAPDLAAWVKGSKLSFGYDEEHKNPYRAFLASIVLSVRKGRLPALEEAINDLRQIEALKDFDLHDMPRSIETARRRRYVLAGLFPEPYARHKKRLDPWVDGLPSNARPSDDSPIGVETRNILAQSYVENGLVFSQFAPFCGMSGPAFIQEFIQASRPPQQRAVKIGLALYDRASRNAFLSGASRYFAEAEKLPVVRLCQLYRKPPPDARDKDLSLGALARCIRGAWCGAATEVIQRAAELRPRYAEKVPAEWRECWRQMTAGEKPQEPLSLDQCVDMLRYVRVRFAGEHQKPLMPDYLHNKPGSALGVSEISPQAGRLLRRHRSLLTVFRYL